MGDEGRPRGPRRAEDDLTDLGELRGVVLEGNPTVQTVSEPPAEPAQPVAPSDADSGDDS